MDPVDLPVRETLDSNDDLGGSGASLPAVAGTSRPPSRPVRPGVLRRAQRWLVQALSAPGRLRRPDGKEHYRALAVADVDLSAGSATLLPPITPSDDPLEGVHALAWFHGEPVGEVTVIGEPEAVLRTLPDVAARQLEPSVLQHLLRDALATAGGVRRAVEHGIRSVQHPARPALDASDVTIAVCTRDRPEDLARCLAAIERLTTRAAEVLVVDNAPRDERSRIVAHDFGVRYVREPRAGLDWARNRALLEATTRIVAFTDDDVLVHPGWLRGILQAFAEEPDAVVVTGLVAPAELTTPAQVLFEAQGGFGRGYTRKWLSVAVDLGDVAARFHPGTGGVGTGANTAVLREPILALGGFDPALDVGTPTGGGGDLEMYFRVLASGGLVVYEPTAVVRHVHRRTMEQLARQMRGHGTGSYSIFLGAGLRYGSIQAREFVVFAWRWAARHHLRTHLRSLMWPRLWPGCMPLAETRGMLDAIVGRYYARALAQAEEQLARHPLEPRTPPLVRPRASHRRRREADPVLTVDLLGDDLVGTDPAPSVGISRRARRLRISVTREGKPQATFPVWTRGSRPSAARLRSEVVNWLGPAAVTPGMSWADLGIIPATTAALAPAGGALARVAEDGSPLDPEPTVTVLMASRDRPGPLRRSVEALLRENPSRRLQVVVVDNSADPGGTQQALGGRPGVRVLHEARPGLSRARNAALPVLTGDVVVLLDDDVEITQGWLDALLEPFEDPAVEAVTGNVLPADLAALESQLFEDYGGLGRGPHRHVYDLAWLRASRRPAPTWHIGATANAAIRRTTLERLGPFDEALGAGRPAGVGEDTEYFYRILHAGGLIAYQPTAIVLHHHRTNRPALRRQLRAYSAGHVAYHLEILVRYGDARGLRRVMIGLPRSYLRRGWRSLRGRDDYPGDLLAAEVCGTAAGIPAWGFSRWPGR